MVGHMTDYWHHHPPVHVLVAGYLGYKPTQSDGAAPDLAANMAALAADMRDDLPPHLRAALDAFVVPAEPLQ
ncbi:hypothetical protein PS659_03308 [Pseudomonas fluorescens]|uniref:Uncharacterized protein n=2 Tax=Pseudomonas TaxID=286 RepID=A0A5E6UGG7_PSEFL|nr:hypothetical protein PS659_03308 [Pseudomonas fluorescens]